MINLAATIIVGIVLIPNQNGADLAVISCQGLEPRGMFDNLAATIIVGYISNIQFNLGLMN